MYLLPFIKMELQKREHHQGPELEGLRRVYFDSIYNDFFESHRPHSKNGLEYFDLLTFIGERQRQEGVDVNSLKKSGILILSVCPDDCEYDWYRRISVEWLVGCKETLVWKNQNPDQDLIDIFTKILDEGTRLRIEEINKKGKPSYSGTIVAALGSISSIPEMQPKIKSEVLQLINNDNVFDRRSFFYCLDEFDSDVAVDLLSKFFEEASPDLTIDIVQQVSKANFWDKVASHFSEVPIEKVEAFWQSVAKYISNRQQMGYGNSFEEAIEEVVMDKEIESKLMIPEAIRNSIFGRVEIVNMAEGFDFKILWEELTGRTNIDRAIESLCQKSYEERLKLLTVLLPHEHWLVKEFIAQLTNIGLPGKGDKAESWETWTHRFEFDWKKIEESDPVRTLWKRIKTNPSVLAYQLGYWLANFPVKSLSEIGLDRIDILEGVRLEAGESELCGYAEIYMEESLNLNQVSVVYGGKLLLKKIGNLGALCTEDFQVVDSGGDIRVFKRGFFYSPHGNNDEWRYARPVGGDEIPKAAEDLLHLADRWLERYKSGNIEGVFEIE